MLSLCTLVDVTFHDGFAVHKPISTITISATRKLGFFEVKFLHNTLDLPLT